MIELCACGHENDHVGRPCRKPAAGQPDQPCGCQSGVRVDVATLRVLAEQNQILAELTQATGRVLALVETASGLQSRIVGNGNGGFRIEVRKKPDNSPRILRPV